MVYCKSAIDVCLFVIVLDFVSFILCEGGAIEFGLKLGSRQTTGEGWK